MISAGTLFDTVPFYTWVDYNTVNKDIYGGLYNWGVVCTEKICPAGWHVPGNEEWDALGNLYSGGQLMESGTAHWPAPNEYATNESGFTALPAGNTNEHFKEWSFFWTSDEENREVAWMRYIVDNTSTLRTAYDWKEFCLSIRCVKN